MNKYVPVSESAGPMKATGLWHLGAMISFTAVKQRKNSTICFLCF